MLRIVIGGSELDKLDKLMPFVRVVPFSNAPTSDVNGADSDHVLILPGFREGLRTMWEIAGYISPEGTAILQDLCLQYSAGPNKAPGVARLLERLAEGLKPAVALGYGLVIERE